MSQDDEISTVDFIQIIDDQRDEAIYYYQNNWQILRDQAVEKGFISSYQFYETPFSEEAPFHIILITTYSDRKQYEKREENFGELIKANGPLKLLNDLQPGSFRKTLFSKEEVTPIDKKK